MKHNPGFLTEEQLVASFVVRDHELQRILRILRENTAASNQHVLVVGKRGMGKTTLAHRVAAEVRRAPDLQQAWYPIVFAEESYQVSTAGEFWLEALSRLALETGERRWREAHQQLSREQDDTRLRCAALARLMDFADEKRCRLLLVPENLQDLLGGISDEDGWALRHVLQAESRLMLLATATHRFDEIDSPNKAAYELFDVIQVNPLDDGECRDLWESVTGRELTGRAIRPISILTGGNPRLVAVLATFARGRSLRALMEALYEFIDDHTDYLRSTIEALPTGERRTFVALCDAWEACLARDVASRARLAINETSANLGRLERRGAVEVVGKEGRAKRYQVAERLYNIYHLLRAHGDVRSRVEGLVRFMTAFYTNPMGLAGVAVRVAQEACELEPEARREHVLAYDEIVGRHRSDRTFCEHVVRETPRSFYPLDGVGPERDWDAAVEAVAEIVADAKHASYHCDELVSFGARIAAHRPERMREILAPIAKEAGLEPLLVAIELDLSREVVAPAEVVAVARDVLEDIRRFREDDSPPSPAAAPPPAPPGPAG